MSFEETSFQEKFLDGGSSLEHYEHEIDISNKPYANFYRQRIVTISAHSEIGEMSHPINVEAVYYFAPITWLNLKPGDNIRKYQDTYPGEGGHILEASFKKRRRGLKVRDSFQNATTVSVSTSQKNIGFKIFTTTTHVYGAKSLASVEEGMETLFNMFTYIQHMSDKIREKDPRTERTWEYVIRVTKGQPCNRTSEDVLTKTSIPKCNMILQKVVDDHLVVMPDEFPLTEQTRLYDEDGLPLNLDIEFANYLLNIVPDYQCYGRYYSNLIDHLSYMRTAPKIIEERPTLRLICTSMMNHTIDLGFNIKRVSLSRIFKNIPRFETYYDNADRDFVEIRFDVTEIVDNNPVLAQIIKFNKRRKVIVRIDVPESGQAKISGPCHILNEYVYNQFMSIIMSPDVYNRVRKKNGEHELRFVPPKALPLIVETSIKEQDAVNRNIMRAQQIVDDMQRKTQEEIENRLKEGQKVRKNQDVEPNISLDILSP